MLRLRLLLLCACVPACPYDSTRAAADAAAPPSSKRYCGQLASFLHCSLSAALSVLCVAARSVSRATRCRTCGLRVTRWLRAGPAVARSSIRPASVASSSLEWNSLRHPARHARPHTCSIGARTHTAFMLACAGAQLPACLGLTSRCVRRRAQAAEKVGVRFTKNVDECTHLVVGETPQQPATRWPGCAIPLASARRCPHALIALPLLL